MNELNKIEPQISDKNTLSVPDPALLIPQMGRYNKRDKDYAKRVEIALSKDDLPDSLGESLFILTMRKGGRKIGVKHGLVTDAQLEEAIDALIPQVCNMIGADWDSNYANLSKGICMNLRENFGYLTLEELYYMHKVIYMMPLELIPESYNRLNLRRFLMVVKIYNDFIYKSSLVERYLVEECKLESEKKPKNVIPEDWPEKQDTYRDSISKLYDAFIRYFPIEEIKPNLYLLAIESLREADEPLELVDYVINYLFTLNTDDCNAIQANISSIYPKELDEEKKGLKDFNIFEDIEKRLKVLTVGFQLNKWKSEGLLEPPEVRV